MNDQEFGDHIAELVSIRATLTPVDFANRVVALSSELTISRNARKRVELFRLADEHQAVMDQHRRAPRPLATYLPEPECYHGYSITQVRAILGLDRYDRFFDWMSGQTMAICEGRKCGTPHGGVVYPSDLGQFLAGGRPLD